MPPAAASPAFLKDGQILKSRLSLIKVLLALILSSIALAFFNAGQFFRVRGDADGCSALILQEELMRGSLKASLIGMALTSSVALMASSASAANFPAYGNDSGPGFIITVTNAGDTITATGQGPYDGADDTYIGIINNSSSSLSSINLSSPNGTDIFGFDGDGIDTYGAPGNSSDNSGYGGPDSYFTNINSSFTSGTVNFVTALAAGGGNTYFSLEESLTPSSIAVTPLPASLPMFGGAILALGALGYSLKRRSSQANGAAAV